LAGLGRPGGDLALLTFAGLVVLFMLGMRARSLPVALGLGIAYGSTESAIAFWGSLSWGLVVPVALSVLCVLIHHLPLVAWGHISSRRLPSWAAWLGAAALGAMLEGFAESIGFPHKFSGVFVGTWPAPMGLSRWLGSSMVSGLLVGLCFVLARLLLDQRVPMAQRCKRCAALTALGLASLYLASSFTRWAASPALGSLSVGIIQQDVPSEYALSRMASPTLRQAFRREYSGLVAQLSTSELLVHTESYDAAFPLVLPERRSEFAQLARSSRQHVLATSYLPEQTGKKSNAAALFGPDGTLLGVHRKVQLAPFGEDALHAGAEFRPLTMASGTRLGVLICMESILPEGPHSLVRQGAQLLVVPTSDTTFGSSVTAFEHLALTQLRAIETGRDVVWASNAGPSGVIDRWGRLRVGPFQQLAAVRATASTYDGLTLYTRFRWFWSLLPILLFALSARRLGKTPVAAPQEAASSAFPLWRRLVTAAAALLVAAVIVTCTPALVQVRRGHGSARAAVLQHFQSPRTIVDKDPYAPFRNVGPAAAAVSYLLTYYGLDVRATELDKPLPKSATVPALARYLETHYGVKLYALHNPTELPALAGLTTTKDGKLAVFESSGLAGGTLFMPDVLRHVPAAPSDLSGRSIHIPVTPTNGSW
jgi:apolipoprotein N-acyltransferase